MIRALISIFPLLFIFTLLFNSSTSGTSIKSDACRRCHEKTYTKSLSNPYRHSVVLENCALCHINQKPENNIRKSMRFPLIENDNILYLGNLDEDKKYRMEIVATSSDRKSSEPVSIDIDTTNIWKFRGNFQPLQQISGVMVDEVKKSSFVHATISWDTDAYATSEIEYLSEGRYPRKSGTQDIFSRTHKITIKGLKHKRLYRFRVISRDIYGNILKSDEYTIDTSTELSHTKGPEDKELFAPFISLTRIFKVKERDGIFLRLSTNKASEILLRLSKVNDRDDKHGNGFVPDRFSKIEICYKCHPHDSSHPVGVRARGQRIKTPDNLPTIEGGIITCVTCHNPHGGKRVYFNRADFRKDLCIECHVGGYL